ncbi:envelope glycoprotein [Striga asiatica]|uniref:Envelope glycoprotein n=1 Tax=Striga asiatica TaxID=4170 RepID=A0A5A7PMW5_STRAF|nr:envelope glycoprotein [Striga asiatica]
MKRRSQLPQSYPFSLATTPIGPLFSHKIRAAAEISSSSPRLRPSRVESQQSRAITAASHSTAVISGQPPPQEPSPRNSFSSTPAPPSAPLRASLLAGVSQQPSHRRDETRPPATALVSNRTPPPRADRAPSKKVATRPQPPLARSHGKPLQHPPATTTAPRRCKRTIPNAKTSAEELRQATPIMNSTMAYYFTEAGFLNI